MAGQELLLKALRAQGVLGGERRGGFLHLRGAKRKCTLLGLEERIHISQVMPFPLFTVPDSWRTQVSIFTKSERRIFRSRLLLRKACEGLQT